MPSSLKTPDKCPICRKRLCYGLNCDACVHYEDDVRYRTRCKLRNRYITKYNIKRHNFNKSDQKCSCTKEKLYSYYKGLYEHEKQQNNQLTHYYYVNIKKMKLYTKYLERRVKMLGGHNAWKK